MNLALTEDQQLLEDHLSRLFQQESTGDRIRASEPLGFDRKLWDTLIDLQVHMLRVPEEQGGSGAGLMPAIVAAEQAGATLASAPLIEAMVANRVLAQLGGDGTHILADCAAGRKIATIALQAPVAGEAQLVPGGAIADVVLFGGPEGVLVQELSQAPHHPNQGSLPFAMVAPAAGARRIEGKAAVGAFAAGIEEWRLLTASLIAAAGRRTLEQAAAYAREREAFGRRIGEYQGVSHPMADSITDLDGARLLTWRAAEAIGRGEAEAHALIAEAFWWSGRSARLAAVRAMRVFGGYGMTMEYDAQLYFRRINAWALAPGPTDLALERIAARRWDGEDAILPDAGEVTADFRWGPEAEAAAARMRAFCQARDTPERRHFNRYSLDAFDPELYREMAAAGLLYPDAPKEFGGPGLSSTAAAAVQEVVGEFDWNMFAPSITNMIVKIIHRFGGEDLKQEVLPRAYRGEIFCALCYTEPSGGSDIFNARTKAVRDGDDWLINGQKMFTSSAHLSDYGLMIARTGEHKYRGVTMFVVPLKQPGFQFNEIKTVSNERTNVTFYSDVRVPDKYRIGEVNGGVAVMAAALTVEQSESEPYIPMFKKMLREALAWSRQGPEGKRPYERSAVRHALAEAATRLSIENAFIRRSVWAQEQGQWHKHFGPMSKLFSSESWLAMSQRLLDLAGPEALVPGDEGASIIEFMSRRSIPSTIYAGTSEIQRSIIAESVLGQPRSRN